MLQLKSAAVLAAILASAILAFGGIEMKALRPAEATPQFATQTGLQCTQCQADLSAPHKLTDFGNAFHGNGDKVPEKK